MVDHDHEIYNRFVQSSNKKQQCIHSLLYEEIQFNHTTSPIHSSDVKVELTP